MVGPAVPPPGLSGQQVANVGDGEIVCERSASGRYDNRWILRGECYYDIWWIGCRLKFTDPGMPIVIWSVRADLGITIVVPQRPHLTFAQLFLSLL